MQDWVHDTIQYGGQVWAFSWVHDTANLLQELLSDPLVSVQRVSCLVGSM